MISAAPNVRTPKYLFALAAGLPIAAPPWVRRCMEEGRRLPLTAQTPPRLCLHPGVTGPLLQAPSLAMRALRGGGGGERMRSYY